MTLSIVARCPRTGPFGISAATSMPAVGKLLTHAAPRVGAVATQARINPYLGIAGLALLRERRLACEVIAQLEHSDPRLQSRQFAVVDRAGHSAAFTGHECLHWAGHRVGDGYSVQGNRLVGAEVVAAASDRFQGTEGRDLADRLLAALESGTAAGGDLKREESATLYVMDTEEYPLWDIRVDLHEDPVSELRRLCEEFRARLLPHILRMPTRKNPAGSATEVSV